MLAAATALAVGATTVLAQNLEVIKQRRDLMKTIATASAANFKMMKGNAPFDLANVQASLKMYQAEMPKYKGLFPDDSKTGGDTDASPRIWQARPEFEAAIDKLVATAREAASAIKDEATLKTEYPKVVDACNNCHKPADGFSPRLADSFKKLSQ
jgi:cytochrome c556